MQTKLPENKKVALAVHLLGGVGATARLFGRTTTTIWKWKRGYQITLQALIDLEKATNGEVKRHEMAPELFEGYELIKEN